MLVQRQGTQHPPPAGADILSRNPPPPSSFTLLSAAGVFFLGGQGILAFLTKWQVDNEALAHVNFERVLQSASALSTRPRTMLGKAPKHSQGHKRRQHSQAGSVTSAGSGFAKFACACPPWASACCPVLLCFVFAHTLHCICYVWCCYFAWGSF